MLNKFEETKRKQRFGLRKLKVGVASVLLGFTIFGFNLASQEVPSVHADVGSASGSDSSSSVANDSSEVPEVSAASENGTNESGSQPAASGSTNTLGGKTGQLRKPVRVLRTMIRQVIQRQHQRKLRPARAI